MRTLREIANEIKQDWSPVYYGARPYLEAMATLCTIDEAYLCDSGRTIVAYFLANASSWRGPIARRVKAELKGLAK